MRDPVQRNVPPRPGGGGGAAAASGPQAEQSGSTGTMSIGEVLGILKPEFPDITVSKIRFLEGAGLVQPDRSASGYRKFSEEDVARLRFVLRAQRDQYLPLRVIRQRLADLEQVGGLEVRGGPAPGPAAPPVSADAPGPAEPGKASAAASPARTSDPDRQPQRPAAVAFGAAPPSDAQFTRDELCRAAGATVEQLLELESFGLVSARGSGERGAWYGGDDLLRLRLARELADYGLEARHLRMYRQFAEREAALFEQVVAPLIRQRNPEARARARDTIEALAQLGGRMRDLALRSAVHGLVETRETHR
jgi:DNA-binding transcriptional MerR regulator